MSKKILKLILWICISIAIATIGFYAYNFNKSPLSSDPSDWGTFGDYIGGILNPILGITNIIVLIYISLLISKYEDKRWSHQLIHDAYKELLSEFEKLPHKKYNTSKSHDLIMYLYSYAYENSYLFDEYEEDFRKFCYDLGGSLAGVDVYVKDYLSEVNTTVDIGQLNNRLLMDGNLSFDEKGSLESLSLNVSKYEAERHRMLTFIKLYIMNKNVAHLTKQDIDLVAKENNEKFNKVQKEHLEMKAKHKTAKL